MKVIKCGENVLIKLSGTVGMITAIVIRFDSVSYEIAFFNENGHQTLMLTEFEFELIDKKNKQQTIGFK